VVVVDIRRGISDLDQALIDMMDNAVPLHILLAKSDKLGRNAISKAVAQTRAQLVGPDQTVSTLSIKTGQGLDLLEQKCREWLTLP
jgi:GTP-binding protein EngB required for normal cell division